MPLTKPRTEWACHPLAATISGRLAPLGCCNRPIRMSLRLISDLAVLLVRRAVLAGAFAAGFLLAVGFLVLGMVVSCVRRRVDRGAPTTQGPASCLVGAA